MTVHLGFLFLFPKPEDLVGDGVVVLLAVGFLDELLLQFLQSGLNAVRRKCIGCDNRSCDVLLQLFQENFSAAQDLVECLDDDILQDGFVYRPIGAVHDGGGWFQTADAAPDHGFAAVIVPMDAAVKLTTFAAKDHLRKAMDAGEAAFLSGWTDVNCPATDKFRLYLHKEILRNNSLMIVLHIVLGHRAIVLDPLLGKEVGGIGLLQQGVSDVLFISQNLVDCARVPFFFSCTGENAVCFQTSGDFIHTVAREIFPINPLHNLSLFRINNQVAIFVLRVSEEAIVVDLNFSLLVAVLQAELHVLREALTFLLCKTRHNRDQYFALGIDNYSEVYWIDLEETKSTVVVSSPRLNNQKVNRIINVLGKRQELGVKVKIITWHPDAYKYGRDDTRMELMERIRKAGFEIKFVEDSCEHYAVIDQEIVWYGSLNLLSKEDAEDNLMRVCSRDIAVELLEMTFNGSKELQEW